MRRVIITQAVIVDEDSIAIQDAVLEEASPWKLNLEIAVGNNGCLTEREVAMTLLMAALRINDGELQESHHLCLRDVEDNVVGYLTLKPS